MGLEQQFRRLAGARSKKPSPPIFSQEFIIQNHGDITSCILMAIFAGFMFQVTSPIANLFVIPQYNATVAEGAPTVYRNGFRDLATIFFYTVAWITAHAIIQEYILDKLQRKLHLSKTKTSKFTESGHLFLFALYSVVHAGYILQDGVYFVEVSKLWVGYPEQHREMSLYTKLFFLLQICYWLHQFPEFYLQKVKKDDVRTRSIYTIIYLAFISAAYILNFTRVALAILFLHYIAEVIFHATRMAYFAEKTFISRPGFKLWNGAFVLVRLGCITLAVLTFWYGLRSNETHRIDPTEGNYNTTFIRLNSLLCVIGVQVFMMWNFIMFHLRRFREAAAAQVKPKQQQRSKQRKAAKKLEDDVRNLPEADQETTRVLRSAKKPKAQ